jgi:hypothetical protein
MYAMSRRKYEYILGGKVVGVHKRYKNISITFEEIQNTVPRIEEGDYR